MLALYDLLGTIVPTDCIITGSFSPRKGFLDAVERERQLGWRIGLFADDKRDLVVFILRKCELLSLFDEIHTGEELDEEGLKNLGQFSEEVVFFGDMPRDRRAAEKYSINFVHLPPFMERSEPFDFRYIQEIVEAALTGDFKSIRRFGMKELGKGLYEGDGVRLILKRNRFILQILL